MAKKSDLRAGNWILVGVQYPKEERAISEEEVQMVLDRVLSAKPIELTGEWFRRFGFIKKGPFWNDTNSSFKVHNSDKKYWVVDSFNQTWGPFEYVHQLQNLYSDLIGEELSLVNHEAAN